MKDALARLLLIATIAVKVLPALIEALQAFERRTEPQEAKQDPKTAVKA